MTTFDDPPRSRSALLSIPNPSYQVSTQYLVMNMDYQPPVPPCLRNIIAWKHIIVPNQAGVFTLDGYQPEICIWDTGANYVMIGKRVADMMKINDEDLHAGISYTMASGETARCRGVTKRKVKVCLNEGTPDEACVYLHILVDNAISYDVLIGAHFTHRVTNSMNFCEIYVEYNPD